MTTHQHAPQSNDHGDELDQACRQMLAQTMRPCRELSAGERAAKRADDRRQQRWLEERAVELEERGGLVLPFPDERTA